jgi:hypothetical protein
VGPSESLEVAPRVAEFSARAGERPAPVLPNFAALAIVPAAGAAECRRS